MWDRTGSYGALLDGTEGGGVVVGGSVSQSRETTSDDKIHGDIPSCDGYIPFLDKKDCTHIAEVINELTRSIHERFNELKPGSPTYGTHRDRINLERQQLNKCIQKFKDNDCGNGSAAIPPEFDMVWAEDEASRRFPDPISLRDAITNRGLGVPIIVGGATVCLLCPACCAILVGAGSGAPVPARGTTPARGPTPTRQ